MIKRRKLLLLNLKISRKKIHKPILILEIILNLFRNLMQNKHNKMSFILINYCINNS